MKLRSKIADKILAEVKMRCKYCTQTMRGYNTALKLTHWLDVKTERAVYSHRDIQGNSVQEPVYHAYCTLRGN